MGKDVVRGDVPTLILAVLSDEAAHGYAIARKVELTSNNALQMREGTLYPALRQLEQQGFVTSSWEIQESGPARKVYVITEAGRKELGKRTREWEQYTSAVDTLLGIRRISHA